jgi:hypothetical protein
VFKSLAAIPARLLCLLGLVLRSHRGWTVSSLIFGFCCPVRFDLEFGGATGPRVGLLVSCRPDLLLLLTLDDGFPV